MPDSTLLATRSPNAGAPAAHRRLFGFRVAGDDAGAIAGMVLSRRRTPTDGVGVIATPNIDSLVLLRENPDLVRAYDRAAVIVCDGFPLRYYARLRGVRVGRVTGCDIASHVMRQCSGRSGHRMFFVVDGPATASAVRAWAARAGLAGLVETCIPPYGFERDRDYCLGLARAIQAHGTSILMMGIGAPKSEVFADTWRAELPPCWVLCVGQAIKAELGLVRRAPPLVQRLHGEWLWRLLHEPRRLARRYVVAATLFPVAVAEDLLGRWQPAGGERA